MVTLPVINLVEIAPVKYPGLYKKGGSRMKYSEFKKHYVINGCRVSEKLTSSFNDGLNDLPKTADEFDEHMNAYDVNATFYTVCDPFFRIVKSSIDGEPLDRLTYVDLVDEIKAMPDDDFDFTITEEVVSDEPEFPEDLDGDD